VPDAPKLKFTVFPVFALKASPISVKASFKETAAETVKRSPFAESKPAVLQLEKNKMVVIKRIRTDRNLIVGLEK
jgi:hypothetical protein